MDRRLNSRPRPISSTASSVAPGNTLNDRGDHGFEISQRVFRAFFAQQDSMESNFSSEMSGFIA